jgi:hypothetical protein
VASSGPLCIGGAGRTRAASLRPIKIVDADAHEDDDIGCSRIAITQRGLSAIQISTHRNLQPILFRQEGSVRIRSWVVNLNPLLPLVVIFYQGERGGVEVEAWWRERSGVKMEVRGVCYHLGGDVEPKNLSM